MKKEDGEKAIFGLDNERYLVVFSKREGEKGNGGEGEGTNP